MEFFKKRNRGKGFTIIEMMISIGIFLIVITYGTTSLLNAYSVNKKSQSFRSILDGLNYVMEDMSRNIRTGYHYKCLEKGESVPTNLEELSNPGNCVENDGYGYGMFFESSFGDETNLEDQWGYLFFWNENEGKLYKSTSAGKYYIPMTSDDIFIDPDKSSFFVFGADLAGIDSQQPLVIINLVGTITSQNTITPFTLQTTVSQRVNDI